MTAEPAVGMPATTERSDLTARDATLVAAVLGCGLIATLMHWVWFRGQGSPPLDLTVGVAFLAATVAAVALRSWLAWRRLRSARRDTDARFAEFDRALTRARRLARDDGGAPREQSAGPHAVPGRSRLSEEEARPEEGLDAATDKRHSAADDDLETMRREWLRDRQVLEAMRDAGALPGAWRRKFGADAPDPAQVMRILNDLLRSPGEESGSQRSP